MFTCSDDRSSVRYTRFKDIFLKWENHNFSSFIEVGYMNTKKTITVQVVLKTAVEKAWDATNYTSSLYFYQLKADNFNEERKMLLVK